MHRIAIAVCLLGACMETTEYQERAGGRTVQKELCPTGCNTLVEEALRLPLEWEQYGDSIFVSVDTANLGDACILLPPDGLCTYACDPDALAANIEPGTCVQLRCDVSDGRTILAGACNAPPTDIP